MSERNWPDPMPIEYAASQLHPALYAHTALKKVVDDAFSESIPIFLVDYPIHGAELSEALDIYNHAEQSGMPINRSPFPPTEFDQYQKIRITEIAISDAYSAEIYSFEHDGIEYTVTAGGGGDSETGGWQPFKTITVPIGNVRIYKDDYVYLKNPGTPRKYSTHAAYPLEWEQKVRSPRELERLIRCCQYLEQKTGLPVDFDRHDFEASKDYYQRCYDSLGDPTTKPPTTTVLLEALRKYDKELFGTGGQGNFTEKTLPIIIKLQTGTGSAKNRAREL